MAVAGNTSAILWTCPAGVTTLVKRLTVASAVAATRYQLYMGAVADANLLRRGTLTTDDSVDAEVWWVLEPGDVLRAYSTTEGANTFSIHGALLAGVA